MLQVLQDISNGETLLVEVPSPQPKDNQILIETSKTLVSPGTERMLLEFGQSNWIHRAYQQPEKVKQVIDKIKTEGLAAAYEAVESKLNKPIPLGYCNVGTVIDSGKTGFSKGDRVVSNGFHAEVVRVPKNLVVKIPDEVDDESASFTVLGAIAMQGIRLIKPSIGESVVVIGLGLIGLLAIQILKASGCRVLGLDNDYRRCEIAKSFGIDVLDVSKNRNLLNEVNIFSRGRGVDGVLITASSPSNEIIHQAAQMSKKKGKISLIGVVGLDIRREDFYEKELSFQVSCSYGPGRYDDKYEIEGFDYPFEYVRWTEQRNFESVLDLMANGSLNLKPLITHRHDINNATEAYKDLDDKSSLGIILNYADDPGFSNYQEVLYWQLRPQHLRFL